MTQLLAMGAAGREAIKLLPLDVQVCRQLAEKPSSFFQWTSRYAVSWPGSHQASSSGRPGMQQLAEKPSSFFHWSSGMPSAGREAIKLLPLELRYDVAGREAIKLLPLEFRYDVDGREAIKLLSLDIQE